jgi:tRNA nucleotidyltransferase (CCA-adding enzyme)
VPVDCRDAARLAARWHGVVHRAHELRPATLLDLINEADAFRRPERLDTLLLACAADACSRPGHDDYAAANLVRDAFAVAKSVDAGAVARAVLDRAEGGKPVRPDAVAGAVRTARLKALRAWKAARIAPVAAGDAA